MPSSRFGYTSISFTTQSESVPLVEATRCTTGSPESFIGRVSGSVSIGQHVRAAIDEALIGHQPGSPADSVCIHDGPRPIGHGLCRIGNIFSRTSRPLFAFRGARMTAFRLAAR